MYHCPQTIDLHTAVKQSLFFFFEKYILNNLLTRDTELGRCSLNIHLHLLFSFNNPFLRITVNVYGALDCRYMFKIFD